METEAIMSILQMCRLNDVIIVGSEILEIEISQIKDDNKRQKVSELYRVSALSVKFTPSIQFRAEQIRTNSKIRLFDSLHIAVAETAGVKVLLTTDDKLIKMASCLDLRLKVINPLKFVWEVMFEC